MTQTQSHVQLGRLLQLIVVVTNQSFIMIFFTVLSSNAIPGFRYQK